MYYGSNGENNERYVPSAVLDLRIEVKPLPDGYLDMISEIREYSPFNQKSRTRMLNFKDFEVLQAMLSKTNKSEVLFLRPDQAKLLKLEVTLQVRVKWVNLNGKWSRVFYSNEMTYDSFICKILVWKHDLKLLKEHMIKKGYNEFPHAKVHANFLPEWEKELLKDLKSSKSRYGDFDDEFSPNDYILWADKDSECSNLTSIAVDGFEGENKVENLLNAIEKVEEVFYESETLKHEGQIIIEKLNERLFEIYDENGYYDVTYNQNSRHEVKTRVKDFDLGISVELQAQISDEEVRNLRIRREEEEYSKAQKNFQESLKEAVDWGFWGIYLRIWQDKLDWEFQWDLSHGMLPKRAKALKKEREERARRITLKALKNPRIEWRK